MNNLKPALPTGLKFGVFISIALTVFGLILYLAGLSLNRVVSSLGYLLLAAGLVWAAIEHRKLQNGFITYGKSFSVQFFAGLVVAVISAIWTYLFFSAIAPDLIGEILARAEEEMLQQNPNMSDEELEMGLKWTSAMVGSPAALAIWTLLTYIFVSVILALIISIFVKRDDETIYTPSETQEEQA